MKNKLLVCALIVVCLAVMATGTLAYFTDNTTAHNVITTGVIDIEIQEWADEAKTVPFPETGISNVMPGTSVTKIVEIKNEGSNDAWVRASAWSWFDIEGKEPADFEGLITPVYNTEYWERSSDPDDYFWYYKEKLAPGAVTKPLITAVEFSVEIGNEYQGVTAMVDVYAEAVQADNNGESALTADSWTEDGE